MTSSGREMLENRALRNAALSLVKADIANLRGDLIKRSPGERVMDTAKDAAIDVLDEAAYIADQHRGIASAIVAAIVLWFARRPILDLFFGHRNEDDDRDIEEDYRDDAFDDVCPRADYAPQGRRQRARNI